MIKAILFDLDGTLLPMDNDEFTRGYFRLLCAKLAPHGYDPGALVEGIWAGTAAMIRNDGSRTNEEAFWNKFASLFGEKCFADKPIFELFYQNEFQTAKAYCRLAPESGEIVALAKAKGYRTVLATNPIFPAIATESRMRWAGLAPEDFEFYTTYENMGTCKPNPAYYREILRRISLEPEACLMVGNDVDEDMIAAEIGMPVYLLTDCLINRSGRDLSAYPHGTFANLKKFIETL